VLANWINQSRSAFVSKIRFFLSRERSLNINKRTKFSTG